MRDIKFRAWDRLCKCYWYQGFAISPDGRVENLHGDIPKARIQAGWTIDKSYDSNLTGFDLEEYTGLKDKKQNDAYLSDIAIDEFDQRWVVVWDDENAGYVLLLEGVAWADADESSVMLMQAIKDMEIIGTIHDEESKEIEP